MPKVCLNIGGGETPIEGYETVDRKNGMEAYPLSYEDGSVDEIYASHVLEHFPHNQTSTVVNNWASKLAPGGRLRIAVPDFQWIAKHYLDGKPIDVQGYTMGGHTDENDEHHAIFDRETLHELMVNAGLERVAYFQAEHSDCTKLPVSLNLQGFKPVQPYEGICKMTALLSAPRFGPTIHMRCALHAFGELHIPYKVTQGAYWHQILSQTMEKELKNDIEYLLVCDYDSVFDKQDVMELARLMQAYPEADAICPMQMKRGSGGKPLFGIHPKDSGNMTHKEGGKSVVYSAEFLRNLTRITTGHFGLTVFRAESLRAMSRPWFLARASKDGLWEGEDQVDADIGFWLKWRDEKKQVFLANHIAIGHMEETIIWPGDKFQPVHQSIGDYSTNGIPKECRR